MTSPVNPAQQQLAASLGKALARMEEIGNALLEHFDSFNDDQASSAYLVLEDLATRTVLFQNMLRQPLDNPDMASLAGAMLTDTQSLFQKFA
ncbi:hypothetical protein CEK28_10590 [Xenophilus sp. AP218F]|nr:hypothetical protein CEK28_10590 [Xenophilus sp. AP218F]